MSTELSDTTVKTQYLKGDEAAGKPLAEGYLSIAMSDANTTLTAAQFVNRVLRFTGTLSAGRDIVLPLTAGAVYVVINGTTGGFALTAKGSSGSGIAVGAGKTAMVMCDGTNVIRLTADV